jgi:uncharacterized protein (TIGR02302 family)
MVAERVVRCFWPFWSVLFITLAPLMMGWQDVMPVELLWSFAVFCLIGLLASAVWGALRFRWPTRDEALSRVDAAMPGRPIAALTDRQAIGAGDSASVAVWQAHLDRMAERTRAARAVEPDLRVSSRDPYGLRFMALILFMAAFLFGSLWRVGTVTEVATGGDQVLATGPVWEGWVEPPAYTGRPSLYLADIPSGALSVPQGSIVTLRLYGEIGSLTVAETVSGRTGEMPPATDQEQSFEVTQEGTLAIVGDGGAEWDVGIVPDLPPAVELTSAVEADAMGEMSQPFKASDDYGVMSGTATIVLDETAIERRFGLETDPDPREPIVVDLPMPFTGDRAEFEERLIENFSEHPFANLPVTVTLSVTDAAGQTTESDPSSMVLPGRRFFQPMARAVIEQRRDLLWSLDNARRVVQVLRAVSYVPDDIFTDQTTYLRLSFIIRRLDGLLDAGTTISVAEQDEIAKALWDLAVQLEDGTLADARERLRRAQERLSEAMRNGASDEEIAELMQELREATNDYLNMLAQNAEPAEDQTDQPQTAEDQSNQVTQDEIQALMDRIQELMEEGRMAEAAELMEQLNQLMENLQVTQGDGSGNGPRTPGQQSMQDLQETLRDQQDLSDEAFRDLQNEFNGREPGEQQGQPGQEPGQEPGEQPSEDGQGAEQPGQQEGQGPGQGGDPSEGQEGGNGEGRELADQGGTGGQDPSETLADRQRALRGELERQQGNLPGLTGEDAEAARRALEQAEGAMDDAEQALRDGRMAEAIDRQADAMDALREGLRSLGEALAQNDTEPGQGETDGAEAQGRVEPARRDPLGRQLGNNGQFGSDENMLQGEDIYRRAEELLDEIRKRAAEQERPTLELDYLRRLLERF